MEHEGNNYTNHDWCFSSEISWLVITVSLESILSKLRLLGTVKLRTLGKVAVVVKRVARASSLQSAEPAFNLPIPFSAPANRNAGPMAPECNHPGRGRETSPRGPHLTRQSIKNYGLVFHAFGRGEKAPPCFSLISEPPNNILILCL